MKQNPSLLLPLATALFACTAMQAGAVTLLSFGAYDENTNQANTVDNTAPGSLNLATFTTDIAAAWAADTGGVIRFDEATNDTTANIITTTFGIGGTGSLSINNTSATTNNFYFQINGALGSSISGNGTQNLYLRSTVSTHSFSFSTGLTHLGFTVLTRTSGDRTVNATVTFNDNTTALLTDTITASGSPTDDTFFGFAAPTGKTIKSVVLTAGTNNWFAIDDLAYIVPEPSTALLAALGSLFLLRRKR